MQKIKSALFSERGINILNSLFFLSLCLFRGSQSLAAGILWAVFLAFGIKNAPTKAGRVVNALLLAFIAVMLALNAVHALAA